MCSTCVEHLSRDILNVFFYHSFNGLQTIGSSCAHCSERTDTFSNVLLEVCGGSLEASLAKYVEGEMVEEYKCGVCNKKVSEWQLDDFFQPQGFHFLVLICSLFSDGCREVQTLQDLTHDSAV